MSATWYVDSSRDPVDWDQAVVSGVAQTTIYRLVSQDDVPGFALEFLWAREGSQVSAGDLGTAVAETSGDGVPDAPAPASEPYGFDRVLVLDQGAPVPAGLPAETVVVRRSS